MRSQDPITIRQQLLSAKASNEACSRNIKMLIKRNRLFGFLTAAVATLIALAIIELSGLVIAYRKSGEILYLRTAQSEKPPEQSKPSQNAVDYQFTVHPYWGFSGPSSAKLWDGRTTNQFGFIQPTPVSIPFNKSPHDVVIAVFGGSVAHNLVWGSRGGLTLAQSLSERSELHGHRPLIINMAQGGGKQPQQLMELAYLLSIGQKVDIVLNVDGFNEFALGYLNAKAGISTAMPATQVMLPLVAQFAAPRDRDPEYIAYVHELTRTRSNKSDAERHEKTARTGATFLYAYFRNKFADRKLEGLLKKYDNFVNATKPGANQFGIEFSANQDNEAIFDRLFREWLESSRLMRAMSVSAGARYLHIVQPNQYFTKRQFSKEERGIALSLPPDHGYVIGATRGYAKIAEANDVLNSDGIISAMNILDDIPGIVYADNCCHYNAVGETALAQFVALQIAAQLPRSPGIPQRD